MFLQHQITFWWEIKYQDPIKDKFGVPIMTSGRVDRAPVRLMLAIDVSHSMSEPFGDAEGLRESECCFILILFFLTSYFSSFFHFSFTIYTVCKLVHVHMLHVAASRMTANLQ